ncbi:MAG: hypothetical protein M1281_12045 [Chloroflexi bacterium]|nr:hypothetical protein [Chloroflexota bacterium]
MKWVMNILGVLLVVVGVIWILQGLGVIPGSFMTGQIQYTYLGIVVGVIGGVLLFLANRRSKVI